jgi:hypothetical protein
MAAFRTLDHCGSIRAEHPITTGVRWLASLLCISCLIVTKVAAEEYGRTDRWVIESAPEGVEEDPFSCSVAPIFGVQRFDIHVLKKTGEGLLTLETPQEAFAPLLGKPLRVRLIFDQAREMLLPAYWMR